jgi:hypothetical protein
VAAGAAPAAGGDAAFCWHAVTASDAIATHSVRQGTLVMVFIISKRPPKDFA